MKKTFLLLSALIMSILMANAQEAYENSAQLDKNTAGVCVSIKVEMGVKDAQKVMESLLKNEGLKGGKSSNQKIAYETLILFSTLSPQHINLFVSFEETGKEKNASAIVNLFVKKGKDAPFETSTTDPDLVANVKKFLEQNYVTALYDYDIAMKIEAKKKEIEQTQKGLDNLQKQIDNRTKDIEKAKATIEKAETDIENAKNSIENQKQVLARQQEELSKIK